MIALRELMAAIALLSLFLAVETTIGRTAHQSGQSTLTIALVGSLVITTVFKLVSKWLGFKGGFMCSTLVAVISTACFLTYFGLAMAYYHPKLYSKFGFSTAAAYLTPGLFVVSWIIAWVFDKGYNGTSDSAKTAG